MALARKGLEHEARPTRCGQIAGIANGAVRTCALRDGERLVVESWPIARHPEAASPDRRAPFGGPAGEAVTRFVQWWSRAVQHEGLFGLTVADLWRRLVPEHQDDFRRTRGQRIGCRLEVFQAGCRKRVERFRESLRPRA